jgi:CubicO group peptidase (beta-lactamase class C family)
MSTATNSSNRNGVSFSKCRISGECDGSLSKRFMTIFAVVLLSFSSTSCSKHQIPSNLDVDDGQLDQAYAHARQLGSLRSLLVIVNGSKVREEYFGGSGPDSAYDVRSVTKSIVSLLIGLAVEQGFVRSEEQSIGAFLSTVVDTIESDKASLTIRHLLTMSSGLDWQESGGAVTEYNAWTGSPDQIKYVLDKAFVAQPGQLFNYNSGTSHLLSVIVMHSSGMSTADFAYKYLFEPIGIGRHGWLVDKQGFNYGSAGIRLRADDMVKIGNLVANRGVYEGQQIVSSEWIARSTQFQITTNNAIPYGSGYGYCWWIGQVEGRDFAMAMGWGGQFIVVVPSLSLVVTATNEWRGIHTSTASVQWDRTLSLIMTQILPAFH